MGDTLRNTCTHAHNHTNEEIHYTHAHTYTVPIPIHTPTHPRFAGEDLVRALKAVDEVGDMLLIKYSRQPHVLGYFKE